VKLLLTLKRNETIHGGNEAIFLGRRKFPETGASYPYARSAMSQRENHFLEAPGLGGFLIQGNCEPGRPLEYSSGGLFHGLDRGGRVRVWIAIAPHSATGSAP
jgi:hypothetical protein